MRDARGNEWRWEVVFDWRTPNLKSTWWLWEHDCLLDGGTRFWHLGCFTLYKWYVQSAPTPSGGEE